MTGMREEIIKARSRFFAENLYRSRALAELTHSNQSELFRYLSYTNETFIEIEQQHHELDVILKIAAGESGRL